MSKRDEKASERDGIDEGLRKPTPIDVDSSSAVPQHKRSSAPASCPSDSTTPFLDKNKVSSSSKKNEPATELIAMNPIGHESRKSPHLGVDSKARAELSDHSTATDKKRAPAAPIPPADLSEKEKAKDIQEKPPEIGEEDLTEKIDDIGELKAEKVREISEWSDEEEAGGLPRVESHASRISRAVRQLFCCGVAYEAPSEDAVSCHRTEAI